VSALPPDQRAAIAAARQARQELGWGIEAPFADILKLIEDAGGVPVTIAELPNGISGALLVERQRPFIIINGRDYPTRQRFTLAHEYGHHRLGHGEVVDGPGSFSENQSNPQESQANYFASEFLAPVPAVTAWMEARDTPPVTLELVVEFSIAFGISPQAARIRLQAARYMPSLKDRRELDSLIQRGEHRDVLFRLGLPELVDTVTRAQDHLPRLPSHLRRTALAVYERGLLDVEQLSRVLRQDPDRTRADLAEYGITQIAPGPAEPDY
jgi:Zn-dependent peptidase ImmA (M78 family)